MLHNTFGRTLLIPSGNLLTKRHIKGSQLCMTVNPRRQALSFIAQSFASTASAPMPVCLCCDHDALCGLNAPCIPANSTNIAKAFARIRSTARSSRRHVRQVLLRMKLRPVGSGASIARRKISFYSRQVWPPKRRGLLDWPRVPF